MDKTLVSDTLDAKQWVRECIEMSPGTNLYVLPGSSLFVSNNVLEFPAGRHCHDEYEFVMPLNDDMFSKTDDKDVLTEKQKLTPFNSGQNHGPSIPMTVNKMICIQCDKTFLNELCWESFGKGDVVFENISFDIGNNIRFLFGLFIDESINKLPGYQVMQDSLIKMLFTEIIRRSSNNISTVAMKDKNRGGIKRAIDFLEEQYFSPLSIDRVAAVAGLSISHFSREFKIQTGKTPYSFFNDLRIRKVQAMLLDKDMTITNIAQTCGFSSPSHFSTTFRQKLGITPSEYRKTIY